MKKEFSKDDIYERKPDGKGRISLANNDKIQEARKDGDKKVEVAILGVVEDE